MGTKPFFFFLAAASLFACATQTDVKQVENKLEHLEQKSTAAENATTILAEARESQKRSEAALAVALKNQADAKADHDALITKVNGLSAGLEENAHFLKAVDEKMKKLEERVRELQVLTMESSLAHSQRIEALRREMAEGQAPATVPPKADKKPDVKTGAKQKISGATTPVPAEKVAEAPPAKEKPAKPVKPVAASADDLYNSAYRNFLKGDFAQSALEFTEYVKRYPNTDLSDNSQYWLGEAYANQGKMKEAAEAFNQTAKNYPKSTKSPSALWRAAEIFEKFGAREEVRAILTKIRDNYPASYEAGLADEKLGAIEGQK